MLYVGSKSEETSDWIVLSFSRSGPQLVMSITTVSSFLLAKTGSAAQGHCLNASNVELVEARQVAAPRGNFRTSISIAPHVGSVVVRVSNVGVEVPSIKRDGFIDSTIIRPLRVFSLATTTSCLPSERLGTLFPSVHYPTSPHS